MQKSKNIFFTHYFLEFQCPRPPLGRDGISPTWQLKQSLTRRAHIRAKVNPARSQALPQPLPSSRARDAPSPSGVLRPAWRYPPRAASAARQWGGPSRRCPLGSCWVLWGPAPARTPWGTHPSCPKSVPPNSGLSRCLSLIDLCSFLWKTMCLGWVPQPARFAKFIISATAWQLIIKRCFVDAREVGRAF